MNLLQAGWGGAAARFITARPERSLLTASGVGLGLVMLTVILVLNATMQAALLERMRAEFGSYDVMILTRQVDTGHISAESLALIEQMDEVAYVVPFLTRHSGSPDTPVHFYSAAGHFPSDQYGMRLSSGRLPGPGEIVLPDWLAERMGAQLGDFVTLPFPEGTVAVTVVGMTPDWSATGFFDYVWLSDRLGVQGPSGLMVGLHRGGGKHGFAGLVQQHDPNLMVDLRQGLDEARWKLDGFGTIGAFLSMVALLTGAFLTMGAFSMTVRERGRELALLRTLGASQRQVSRLLVFEALLVGTAGALAGLSLGLAVSRALLAVSSRHLGLPAGSLVIPWVTLLLTLALGVVLALLGAWPAVRLGGRTSPMAAMRPQSEAKESQTRQGRLVMGLALMLLGSAAGAAGFSTSLAAPARFMIAACGAVLLLSGVMVGLAQWLSWLVRGLTVVLALIVPTQVWMAERNLGRHLHRSARTAGVMVLGIAVLVTAAGMIGTESIQNEYAWQQRNPTEGSIWGPWGNPVGFGDSLVGQIAAIEGVAEVIPMGKEWMVDLVDYDPARATAGYGAKYAGDAPERAYLQALHFAQFRRVWDLGAVEGDLQSGLVLTREHAADLGLTLGETLRLRLEGDGVERSLPIGALVDRLPSRGGMVVDPTVAPWALRPGAEYRTAWVSHLPGVEPKAIEAEVQQVLESSYAAFTYTDREKMLAGSQRRMWQNMAFVGLTGLVVLLIASVGLLTTMAANLQGRVGELAAVRALGASPVQLSVLIGLEALLLGLGGSLLGAFTGLAMLLIVAILPSFSQGWPVYLPLWAFAAGLLAGPTLAVLATVQPIRSVVRMPLTSAIRMQ